MAEGRWNRTALCARFRRGAAAAVAEVADPTGGPSRRRVLQGAGLVAVAAPLLADTPDGPVFRVRQRLGRVALVRRGLERLVLRAGDFAPADGGGAVRLSCEQKEGRVCVRLENARFPGLDGRADLVLDLVQNTAQRWTANLRMPGLSASAQGDVAGWLDDRRPLEGATGRGLVLRLGGEGASLSLAGRRSLQVDHDLRLSFSGRGGLTLRLPEGRLAGRAAALAVKAGAPSLIDGIAGPAGTVIAFDVDAARRPELAGPPLPAGSELRLAGTWSRALVEAHERGGLRRAVTTLEGAGGDFLPGLGLRGRNGRPASLALGRLQYVVAGPTDGRRTHFIADLLGGAAQAQGAHLVFAPTAGAGDLELESAGGRSTAASCTPAVSALEIPLGDTVVQTASVPRDARIRLSFFPREASKNPNDWCTLRLNPERDDALKFEHLQTSVVRPADMLVLRFDLRNMELRRHDDRPVLFKQRGKEAFLRVVFQPQHVVEQDLYWNTETAPPHEPSPGNTDPPPNPDAVLGIPRPLSSGLAKPSRLVFRIPELYERHGIPCTPESLLDWADLQMIVNPRAIPTPDVKPPLLPAHWRDASDEPWSKPEPFLQPRPDETEIELPYGISLSPHAWSTWRHALSPVGRDLIVDGKDPARRYELWHTRLGPFQADSLAGRTGVVRARIDITDPDDPRFRKDLRTVRAIWSRGPTTAPEVCDVPPTAGWEKHALLPSLTDGRQIAQLSSDFSLRSLECTGETLPYKPPGIPYKRLHLSAYGGTTHLHGEWQPLRLFDPSAYTKPPADHAEAAQRGFYVDEWIQDVAVGRDQFVLVSYAGFTLWTGHYVSFVTTHERVFLHDTVSSAAPDEKFVAALRRRYYCEVRAPTLDYPEPPPGVRRVGRRTPFKQVTISPTRTPYLKRPWDLLKAGPGGTAGAPMDDCHPPSAFWMIPETARNNDPFEFTITAIDRQDNTVGFKMPLLWVLGSLAVRDRVVTPGASEGATPELRELMRRFYSDQDDTYLSWRTADLHRQNVSFVADPVDPTKDRSIETESATFTADLVDATEHFDATADAPAHDIRVVEWPARCDWDLSFYPAVERARARLGAVARLGSSAEPQEIRYNGWYAAYGFAASLPPDDPDSPGRVANAGGVYLDIFGGKVNFPGAKSGGVAKPNLDLRHVGLPGPIGGALVDPSTPVSGYVPHLTVQKPEPDERERMFLPAGICAVPDLNDSAAIKGIVNPGEMFPDDMMLLGAVRFSHICQYIDGFDKIADAIPKLVEEYKEALGPVLDGIQQALARYNEIRGYFVQIETLRENLENRFRQELADFQLLLSLNAGQVLRDAGGAFEADLDTALAELDKAVDAAVRVVDAQVDIADPAGSKARAAQASGDLEVLRTTFRPKEFRDRIVTPLRDAEAALSDIRDSGFPFARIRAIPGTLIAAVDRMKAVASDPLSGVAALRDLQRTLREVSRLLADDKPLESERAAVRQMTRRIEAAAYQLVEALGSHLPGIRDNLAELYIAWFPTPSDYSGPFPSSPDGQFRQSRAAAFDSLLTSVNAYSDRLRPQLNPNNGKLTVVAQAATRFIGTLGDLLDDMLRRINGGLDGPASVVGALLVSARRILQPVLGEVSDLIDQIPQSVDLKYAWEPALKDSGPFIASRDGQKARLRIDIRLSQDLSGGSGPSFELRGELTDCALKILPDQPFLTVEIASAKFGSKNGSSPSMDLKIGRVVFGDQLEFIKSLAELLSPKTGPYMEVGGDGVVAGFRLPIPNITAGAFSIVNLSINPEVRLQFDGTPMRARLSVSSRARPAIFAMSVYGGTMFVALESEPDAAVSVETAIDAGVVTAIGFMGAQGVATVTFGFYFQLARGVAKLTGYFRAFGSFDVYGLITLNLEFYLGFTYTSDGNAYGECSITVEIGCGMFSYKVTAHAQRQMSGNSGSAGARQVAATEARSTPPIRLASRACDAAAAGYAPGRPLKISEIGADWAAYRAQFSPWTSLKQRERELVHG